MLAEKSLMPFALSRYMASRASEQMDAINEAVSLGAPPYSIKHRAGPIYSLTSLDR